VKDSFDIVNIIRPNILKLQPYTSARDDFKGEASIFLDANENSLGTVGDGEFNRYPDPLQLSLKEKIAKIKDVKTEQIFLGNGSDEAIDLLFRAFCEPEKDTAIIFPPTYGMYKVQANINNTPIVEILLNDDFSLPVEKIKKTIDKNSKLIFICSPNNPTGNLIDKESIIEVLDFFDGLVIVDEAYIDFATEKSMTSEIDNYPNLIVLQTFSKAWGLAGLRLGMAIANENTIQILNNIKYPYNINALTQEYVTKALDNINQKNSMVDTILLEREKLEKQIKNIKGVEKIYPTDANFILVKIKNASQIYTELISKGIVVRNRSSVALCDNSLRITVGTENENIELIKQLAKISSDLA
jgi:histidinol-phosphate aminotransferase